MERFLSHVETWLLRSSEHAILNSRIWKDQEKDIVLYSAKNMSVSCQLCIRDLESYIDIKSIKAKGLPEGVKFDYSFLENIVYNDGIPYPDIVGNKKSLVIPANYTQIAWINFDVSKTAQKGIYDITFVIETDLGNIEQKLQLAVYSTVLSEPKESSFFHEYWTHPFSYIPSVNEGEKLNYNNIYNYELYSKDWWDFIKETAIALKFVRSNVLTIPAPNELLANAGSKRISEDKWDFNFDYIDKFVDINLKYGSFNRICISSLVKPVSGEEVNIINYEGKSVKVNYDTPDAEKYLRAFYPAVKEHFKKKGLLSMLLIHIQDEPHLSDRWKWVKEIFRDLKLEIPCGEPFDTFEPSKELEGYADYYVPRIDVYENNAKYYKKVQKSGHQLWVYSCCFPLELWWLNKLIDQPHAFSRLMEWACFSQKTEGFLHWGFNFWNTPYGLSNVARYKGDGFIVYPDGENNSLLYSVRAYETRDGFYDIDLLNMLKSKKPELALKISRRVAKCFFNFSNRYRDMDYARKEVLELLEEDI